MENHINKLYPRNLSLIGKDIILNTLILAKTVFLSNVFPIPKEILTQLHTKTYQYIWQDKKITNSKKNTFSPQKRRRYKYKRTGFTQYSGAIKRSPKFPPWTYLATYWLAKDIDKFGKEYNYLKNNNRIKAINQETPFYCNDLIQLQRHKIQ